MDEKIVHCINKNNESLKKFSLILIQEKGTSFELLRGRRIEKY